MNSVSGRGMFEFRISSSLLTYERGHSTEGSSFIFPSSTRSLRSNRKLWSGQSDGEGIFSLSTRSPFGRDNTITLSIVFVIVLLPSWGTGYIRDFF